MENTPFNQLAGLDAVRHSLKNVEKERDEMKAEIARLSMLSSERAVQIEELEAANATLIDMLKGDCVNNENIALFTNLADKAEAAFTDLERLSKYSLTAVPKDDELEKLLDKAGETLKAEEAKSVAQGEVSKLAKELASAEAQIGKMRSMVTELESSNEALQKRLTSMNAERLAAQRDAFERTKAAKEIELNCQREVERLRLELMKRERNSSGPGGVN